VELTPIGGEGSSAGAL